MRGGFPHSETPGSRPARGSPGLVAACRVLHRLSAPRHPPGALLSLAPPRRPRRRGRAPRPLTMPTNDKNTNERTRDASPRRANGQTRHAHFCTHAAHATKARARVVSPPHDAKERPRPRGPPPPPPLVGPGRLERPTSRLSGARSNRLSYGPGPARTTRVAARDGGAFGGVGGRDARTARPARIVVPPPRPPAPSVFYRRCVPTRHLPAGRPCGRGRGRGGPRKEVIQPQVPLRLPCYDFTPVANPAVDGRLPIAGVGQPASGRAYSHGVTGGVYKARERIHRGVLIRDY